MNAVWGVTKINLRKWDIGAHVLSSPLDRHGGFQSAEVRLAAAVFEDALRCVTRNIDRRSGPRWQEFVDACDWIWNDRRDWPFAFGNVCGLLALDPKAVRERLEELLAQHTHQANQPTHVKRVVPRGR